MIASTGSTRPRRNKPARPAGGEPGWLSVALLQRELTVLRKNLGRVRGPYGGPAVPARLRVPLRVPADRAGHRRWRREGGRARSRRCSSPAWWISIMFRRDPGRGPADVAGVRLHARNRGPGASADARVARRGAKVVAGAVQGVLAAAIVFPIAAVVHAKGVAGRPHDPPGPSCSPSCRSPAWCSRRSAWSWARASSRATSGRCSASSSCRSPSWEAPTTLEAAPPGRGRRLPLVADARAVNPLLYVTEGFRAALTNRYRTCTLYIIYPVLLLFCAGFLTLGLRNFKRRILL